MKTFLLFSIATIAYACQNQGDPDPDAVGGDGYLPGHQDSSNGDITCNSHIVHHQHDTDPSDCNWYDVEDTLITDCLLHTLASAGSSLDDVVCTEDVRKCKGHDIYVSRNTTLDCKFDRCPRPSWKLPDDEQQKYQNLKNRLIPYTFKNMFSNTTYKDKTEADKKKLKKGVFREFRGEIITMKKDDESELPFAEGGFKFLKRWNTIRKQHAIITEFPFKMVDDPEFEGDAIEVGKSEAVYFEDRAEYKWDGKNFSCQTNRKTEAAGYFDATFENKDTGRKCSIDGSSDKTGCRIEEENTKFEILFAGSTGFSQATVHCLHDYDGTSATYNALGIESVDGSKMYTFNGVPYVRDEYIGVNVGTYVFDNTCDDAGQGTGFECDSHPFIIDLLQINNTEVFKITNCTESKSGDAPNPHDDTMSTPNDGCVGLYTVEVLQSFNIHPYWCTQHGAMGGDGIDHNDDGTGNQGRLYFDDTCAQYVAPAPPTDDDDGMSTGAVVGIAFGAALVAGAVAFGLYRICLSDPIVNSRLMYHV